MVSRIAAKAVLVVLGLALVGVIGTGDAAARTHVFLGFGLGAPVYPYYPPPYYTYPPPVVYAPAPVYVAPPPVVYQTPQSWYYCDNPKGYYPYVTSCATEWRQVPATPKP